MRTLISQKILREINFGRYRVENDLGACDEKMILRPEDVRSLIPEFIPEKITVLKWLTKIDGLKNIYGWEERAVLHYATLCLGAVSRIWYEGVEEHITGWNDFKLRLARAFPTRIDEVDIHNVLLKRVKRSHETYENFVYDIVCQARMVNISEAAIIKYVINGIPDSNLRLALCTANYDTVETLLDTIYRYENQTKLHSKAQEMSSYNEKPVKNASIQCCFNCGQRGHFAQTCGRQPSPNYVQTTVSENQENECLMGPIGNDILAMDGETQSGENCCYTSRETTENHGRVSIEQVYFDILVRLNNRLVKSEALFDTGSPICLIKRSLVSDKINFQVPFQECRFK